MKHQRCWQTASDIGTRRTNEDAMVVRHGYTLDQRGDHPMAVVCDGISAEGTGYLAAWSAAEAFESTYLRLSAREHGRPLADRLQTALEAANDAVGKAVKRNGGLKLIGTTLSAAVVTEQGLHWIGVGDSPIYFATPAGTVRQLNRQPTGAGGEEELTFLTGDPIEGMRRSERPTRMTPGHAAIVACDGLERLSRARIGRTTVTHRTKLAKALVSRALQEGAATSRDNVSVAALIGSELPDGRVGEGSASGLRDGIQIEVQVEGRPLDWYGSLEIANHSPSGPEWGYGGSGPAQLALSLLLAVTDRETATRLYGQYMDEVTARLPREGWQMPLEQAREWVARRRSAGAA